MQFQTFDLLVPLAQSIRLHVANGGLHLWFVSPSRAIDYTTCCKWRSKPLICTSLSVVPVPALPRPDCSELVPNYVFRTGFELSNWSASVSELNAARKQHTNKNMVAVLFSNWLFHISELHLVWKQHFRTKSSVSNCSNWLMARYAWRKHLECIWMHLGAIWRLTGCI